ncbi:MAG: Rieske (2Fe-2S) protein [Dermatophilaceae bacterium]
MSQHHLDHTTPCSCLDRRGTLRAAGLVGAAVAGTTTLAACSEAAEVADAAASAAGAATSAAAAAADALKAAQVPVRGGTVIDSLKVVVTQPEKGQFKAFSAVCPHAGCTVAGVADNVINCACHGSQFDAVTGAVTKGPAPTGLEAKQVTVNGDGLTIS